MDMFDFLVPAALAGRLGLAYLWLVAPRIIPEREPTLADTSPRIFTAHLALPEGSPVIGKTLAHARKLVDGAMKVTSVERGLDNFMIPFPTLVLKADDHLIIRDTPDRLKEFEKILEGTLYADDAMVEPVDDEHPLKDEDQQIAEIVLMEGSRLVGRTLSGIRFADRYGMITLAIHRAGIHPEKLYNETRI